jgi:ribosomal protein S18 acetylase RimI-like enzyme
MNDVPKVLCPIIKINSSWLKNTIRQFTNKLSILNDEILIELWNKFRSIFTLKILPTFSPYKYSEICSNVMNFTLRLITLNYDSSGKVEYLQDEWILILQYLQNSDLRILRSNVKSVKREFPLSLELIQNPLDAHKILNVLNINVLKNGAFNDLLQATQLDLIEKLNNFNNYVSGYSGGTHIAEIWLRSTRTINIFGTNEYDQLLMFGSALIVIIDDICYASITNFFIHPEVVRRGVGALLMAELIKQIESDPISSVILFCVDKNNIPMINFLQKYTASFPFVISNFLHNSYNNNIDKNKQKELEELEELEQLEEEKEPVLKYFMPSDRYGSYQIKIPQFSEIIDSYLEAAKISTQESNKSMLQYYKLYGSAMIRQWFYTTWLGQYLQR